MVAAVTAMATSSRGTEHGHVDIFSWQALVFQLMQPSTQYRLPADRKMQITQILRVLHGV